MRILCVFGRHNYGDPERGEGYEYSNFLPALGRLGHRVILFDNWDRSHHRGFPELNAALLRVVEEQRPDIIFSVQVHFELWLETWQILRDSGIAATINWATDDSWRYDQFSRLVAPAFHAYTTTYPNIHNRYKRDGLTHVLLTQWAANAATLQAPLPAAQCRYNVTFVGTAYGKRRHWIQALRRRGVDVACFGHGWENGAISAQDIPKIIRDSVISLNLANADRGGTNQIKARTFEVPGAGGFLLTEWADGLDRYLTPGREIAVFHSLDELADQIRYYLAHPSERDGIARAGHARTCAEHTYDRRLSKVVDYAVRQRDEYYAHSGATPTGQIDWARFHEAAARHRIGPGLRLLKRILVAAGSAVYGRSRGPRAARRLLFELSWRAAGAHTYSAAGWPGRLFYEVS